MVDPAGAPIIELSNPQWEWVRDARVIRATDATRARSRAPTDRRRASVSRVNMPFPRARAPQASGVYFMQPADEDGSSFGWPR